MKNRLWTLAILSLGSFLADAQVGINVSQGQATLDVVGAPTIPAKLDGIIAPRITGSQLRAKTYTTAQTGALVYVTTADTAPAGQTIEVVAPGYYYFDGSKWLFAPGIDWHTRGNDDITSTNNTLGTDATGTRFLGTNTSTNLIFATNKLTRGVLDTSGTLSGGGTDGDSYLMWGSQNSATKTGAFTYNNALIAGYKNSLINSNINPSTGASATVILGKENTLTYNGVVIGAKNNSSSGSFVIGNNNTASNGMIFGTNNAGTGGNIVIGRNYNNSSTQNTSVVGNSSNVFSSDYQYFQSQATDGTPIFSKVGINVVPLATQESDLKVSKAVQLVNETAMTCSAVNEGSIRYTVIGTTGNFQGCRKNNGVFGWAQLN